MIKNASSQNIIFLYDVAQVDAGALLLRDCKARGEDAVVVANDVRIEYSLRDKNVPFISGDGLQTEDGAKLLAYAEEYVQGLLAWGFFIYRAIPLKPIFAMTLQVYVSRLLYSADVFDGLIEKYSPERVYIFKPPVPEGKRYIVDSELLCMLRSAENLTTERGIACVVFDSPTGHVAHVPPSALSRFFSSVFFFVLNIFFQLGPRKPLRMLVSDNWRNIGPFMSDFMDAQVTLLDRKEFRSMGFLNAWRLRMRFVHVDQYFTQSGCRIALQEWASINERWGAVLKHIPVLSFKQYDLTSVLTETLDGMFSKDVPHAIEVIESSYALFKKVKPGIVLLRATASRQVHFSILALVAKALNIPALELQHGIEHMGRGSYSAKNHSAEYMAVYGPLVKREMVAEGAEPDSIINVGSPRFDSYKVLHKPHEGFVLLCVAPTIVYPTLWTTYKLREYFESVAFVARGIPGCRIIIKLRPNQSPYDFFLRIIRESFYDVPYSLAELDSLPVVASQCDAFVSCHSTVILEAMQCGLPGTLWAFSSQEEMISRAHYEKYAAAGALKISRNQKDLTDNIVELRQPSTRKDRNEKMAEFLKKEFLFDGKGTLRTSENIRMLIKK